MHVNDKVVELDHVNRDEIQILPNVDFIHVRENVIVMMNGVKLSIIPHDKINGLNIVKDK